MENPINTIQLILFALMIFAIAFFLGKKIHLEILPDEIKWINSSNLIFSFSTTLWTLYGALHFQELISMIPIWRFGIPLGAIILVLPYLILNGILRIVERNM